MTSFPELSPDLFLKKNAATAQWVQDARTCSEWLSPPPPLRCLPTQAGRPAKVGELSGENRSYKEGEIQRTFGRKLSLLLKKI